MLTEEKRKEYKENLMVLGEQIKHLKSEMSLCLTALVKDAIERVQANYNQIAIGDKVKVRYTQWDDKVVEDVFYLKDFHMCHYYDDNDMESYVKVDFYKVKKDGTKSLRVTSISNIYIKSIEKVTE